MLPIFLLLSLTLPQSNARDYWTVTYFLHLALLLFLQRTCHCEESDVQNTEVELGWRERETWRMNAPAKGFVWNPQKNNKLDDLVEIILIAGWGQSGPPHASCLRSLPLSFLTLLALTPGLGSVSKAFVGWSILQWTQRELERGTVKTEPRWEWRERLGVGLFPEKEWSRVLK